MATTITGGLCAPALIYLIFSLTQILIDIFKGLYNVSFFKFLVMVLFTILLNILCRRGLSLVSWVIVFVPFMLMSIITAVLLYVFGVDPQTGKLMVQHQVRRPQAPSKWFKNGAEPSTTPQEPSKWFKNGASPSTTAIAHPKHRKHHTAHSKWFK